MAITHGRHTAIYLNGYDVKGVLQKVTFPLKQDVHPTPVFGKSARPKILGLEDASVALDGWLDGASDLPGVLDAAMAAGATDSMVIYLPDGDTFGNYGMACIGLASDVESQSADAPNKLTAGFESKTGGERIGVLKAMAAITGAVNGTNFDVGAATTTECVGYLMVGAMSGFTALDAKVQHSPDNSAWSDLVSFTQITAARRFERVVVASGTTVQRHRRIVLTPTGAGSVEVFAGFHNK